MEILAFFLIVAALFGMFFLVDKVFVKLFRSKQQHLSGKSVKLNKRYATIGIIMFALGTAAAFIGGDDTDWMLLIGGCILVLGGIALVVYYISFGVYYDADSFLFSSFGKTGRVHYYKDIRFQQLYVAGGNVVVELHLADGTALQVHTGMAGIYDFMDHAFFAWLRQTGRRVEDCSWYDPQNSCWFPPQED